MHVNIKNNVVVNLVDDNEVSETSIEVPFLYEKFVEVGTPYTKKKGFKLETEPVLEKLKSMLKDKRKAESSGYITYKGNKYYLSEEIFDKKRSAFVYKFDDGNFIEITYEDCEKIRDAINFANQQLFDLEYEANKTLNDQKTVDDIIGIGLYYLFNKKWTFLDTADEDFVNFYAMLDDEHFTAEIEVEHFEEETPPETEEGNS